jgi:hypothetical protein
VTRHSHRSGWRWGTTVPVGHRPWSPAHLSQWLWGLKFSNCASVSLYKPEATSNSFLAELGKPEWGPWPEAWRSEACVSVVTVLQSIDWEGQQVTVPTTRCWPGFSDSGAQRQGMWNVPYKMVLIPRQLIGDNLSEDPSNQSTGCWQQKGTTDHQEPPCDTCHSLHPGVLQMLSLLLLFREPMGLQPHG